MQDESISLVRRLASIVEAILEEPAPQNLHQLAESIRQTHESRLRISPEPQEIGGRFLIWSPRPDNQSLLAIEQTPDEQVVLGRVPLLALRDNE